MRVFLPLGLVMMLLLAFSASVPVVAEEGTVWEASTTAVLGRAGVTLQIHAPDEVTCDLAARGAGGGEDRLTIGYIEGPGFSGWASAGGGNLVRVHAGPVDTDAVMADGTGHSQIGLGLHEYTFTGDIVVGFAGTNLQPWPEDVRESWPFPGEAPGAHSVFFSLSCDGFVTASLAGGTGAVLMNAAHADGGVGAEVLLAGANVADHAEGVYSAPDVLVATGSFGAQAGAVTFDTPEGQERILLTPQTDPFIRWTGPSGAYGVTLDRVGVYFETFWAVVVGLHPVDTLDEIPSLAP